MKFIEQYLFNIVGEDHSKIEKLHSETIKRIKNYGRLLHIPIIVWFLLGFFISKDEFGLDNIYASGFGFLCAFFVYVVDVSILNMAKSTKINIFRIILGLILAFVAAFFIDTKIFEKDIYSQTQGDKINLAQVELNYKITDQLQLVNSSLSAWQVAAKNAECEADGSCGSQEVKTQKTKLLTSEKYKVGSYFKQKRDEALLIHTVETKNCGLFCSQLTIDKKRDNLLDQLSLDEKKEINVINESINIINQSSVSKSPRGAGSVWVTKNKYANKLKGIYEDEKLILRTLQNDFKGLPELIENNVKENTGLLKKMSVMHHLVFNDLYAAILYGLLTSLFLSLELILIFTKITSPDTVDDKKLALDILKEETKIDISRQSIKEYKDYGTEFSANN